MKARIRKTNKDGHVRIETSGAVKEVLINEDFLHPSSEHISICFKGESSSGIIDLSMREADMIIKAINKKKHLIKGFKVLEFEK